MQFFKRTRRRSRLEGHWKRCPTFLFVTPISPHKWDIPQPDDVESEESNLVPEPLRATLTWDAKTFFTCRLPRKISGSWTLKNKCWWNKGLKFAAMECRHFTHWWELIDSLTTGWWIAVASEAAGFLTGFVYMHVFGNMSEFVLIAEWVNGF